MVLKKVAIASPIKSAGKWRLLQALATQFNICLREFPCDDDSIDAWFFPEANRDDLKFIAGSDRPCFVVISEANLAECGKAAEIKFEKHFSFPSLLNGQCVETDEVPEFNALPQWFEQTTTVASKSGFPVWVKWGTKGLHHDIVSFPIPEMHDGEFLFQHFNGKRFIRLLPLLLFLQNLTRDADWEQPPPRACFMIDDPNLHWPTYGFVDFAQIRKHARENRHHVAFATVPLDGWFVHGATAALFRDHPDLLSLLVHGNDHSLWELARHYEGEEAELILRQALRRVAELEQRSGLTVSKIMAPPHGACGEAMLREMARVGFEAVCVSWGSLHYHNRQAEWLKTIGMNPSAIVAGLAVLPRFRLSMNCRNHALVAVLLGQPIIPVCHHHDLRDGLHIFSEVSDYINSLGPVRWMDMGRISRSHYARKFDGKIMYIEMLTKRLEVIIHEGIHEIIVKRRWLDSSDFEPLKWRVMGRGQDWRTEESDVSIPVMPGQVIEILSDSMVQSDHGRTEPPWKQHLWPLLRRQLAEASDRLAPVRHRMARKRRPGHPRLETGAEISSSCSRIRRGRGVKYLDPWFPH